MSVERTSSAAARVARDRVEPLSVDDILDTAQRLIEEGGVEALSMRKLAAELGVAVTAIYWHVGNREALVNALVNRMIGEMEIIERAGDSVAERVVSIGMALRKRLLARPHLIALVHEQGRTALMFRPALLAITRELHAAGLRGDAAAQALRAIEYHVVGFVVLERTIARSPEQHPTDEELWREEPAAGDPEMTARMAQPVDTESLFEFSLGALVASVVHGEPTGAAFRRRGRALGRRKRGPG